MLIVVNGARDFVGYNMLVNKKKVVESFGKFLMQIYV